MIARHATSEHLARAWWSRGLLARSLLPLALLFGALVELRRVLYRHGWLKSQSLPVPVIVVGNVIVGGAGKTPTVMALAKLLCAQGWHPGVVSRGHGRSQHDVVDVAADTPVRHSGDEPLLMHRRLGVPVTVARDRVAAARELLRLHPQVDVLISDDGLQHLRLARDLQVLVFDDRGVGNGWLLPAGPLREPLPARLPPRTLVLYNATRPSTTLAGSLAQRKLAGALSLQDWWDGAPASPHTLRELAGRRLVAAAGMAHPQRFFDMLIAAGLTITPVALPDHYDFVTLPWPSEARDVIVTEKDAVKLPPAAITSTRVWVAPLDFDLEPRFQRDVLALLPAPPARNCHGQPTS